MATPAPNELRQMILNFYSENDPAKLRMGLDVNGIVEWTTRNGIAALNHMLKKQFGKEIDVNQKLGTATQQFMRMSTTLTPALASIKLSPTVVNASIKENNTKEQILLKLQRFYQKHDPTKMGDLDKLVTFAMYHGIAKLNTKLEAKYGEGIPLGDVEATKGSKPTQIPPTSPNRQLPPGRTPPGLPMKELEPPKEDDEQLRADVIKYYEKVDPDQLDALEAIMDWAMMIGRKELDEKLEQIYGISLNYVTRPQEFTAAPADKSPKLNQKAPALPKRQAELPTAPVKKVSGPDLRAFNEMNKAEIREQLVWFYQKHDEDTIAKIDMIVDLALKLGRNEMNDKLRDIYEETLDDVVCQRYEQDNRGVLMTQRQADPVEFESSEVGSDYLSDAGGNDKKVKKAGSYFGKNFFAKVRKSANRKDSQEPIRSPGGGSFSSMENFENAGVQSPKMRSPPPVSPAAHQLPPQAVPVLPNIPKSPMMGKNQNFSPPQMESGEEMSNKIARLAMERKQREASRLEQTGRSALAQFETEACKNYEIDMLGENMGACVHCGFPKMQHKERVQRVLDIRNSKGLPSVMAMAKEMDKRAKTGANVKPALPIPQSPIAQSYMMYERKASTNKPSDVSSQVTQPKPVPLVKKNPLGPCEKFELDLTNGAEVICSKCGYNKMAHQIEKRKTFQKFFAPIYSTQTKSMAVESLDDDRYEESNDDEFEEYYNTDVDE